jgi:hypothetical protein
MLPSDAYWASSDITSVRVQQIAVERRLTEYHEQSLHHDAGVVQFAEDTLQLIRQADELYLQFMHEHEDFMKKSTDEQQTKLQQLSSRLDYIDRAITKKRGPARAVGLCTGRDSAVDILKIWPGNVGQF